MFRCPINNIYTVFIGHMIELWARAACPALLYDTDTPQSIIGVYYFFFIIISMFYLSPTSLHSCYLKIQILYSEPAVCFCLPTPLVAMEIAIIILV